ncbi:MAG: sigma 54-interacting transcriptional regulator, partial [Thermoanaerobaculia bacterium]
IDALLDRMYVLFSAGRWPEARAAALEGLSVAEETQGDRAAGGFLFVIAYLAADDGQWAHASQRIERLRRFYSGTRDKRRQDELALLSAQLDFSRGEFDAAARQAQTLVDSRHDGQIREAAALIVDESNWILGRQIALQSLGATENVELTDRHRLIRSRRDGSSWTYTNAFLAALAQSERGGAAPVAKSGTERLMLFRSAIGRGDVAAAEAIAREIGIVIQSRHAAASNEVEHAVLRAVAAGDFPFDERPLAGVAWRYATRNRLRQWQQIGPLGPIAQDEIEAAIEESDADWFAASDREILMIDGMRQWSADSRDAVIALFRTKAELFRLRRILEQEESDRPVSETSATPGIIGESTAIRDLLSLVARVARRDVPICILGESGTGKELVARAIHAQSLRRSRPFTALNCAALPENLIESELFGHVRGAFTGADRDRAGVIESTDGGTLFLDEIGEMPVTAQAKLLRFLQDGEFRRVGDTSNRSADVRIVAATNRKLESAVEEGRFREDLYYRIRGLEAVLPPLRDRGRDILLLASHFIGVEREKHRSGPSRL